MIEPYFESSGITIYHGDTLEVMAWLINQGIVIDCVINDPPYYKVVKSEWDNQWGTLEGYIKWLELVIIKLKQLLSTKGSLYIFC